MREKVVCVCAAGLNRSVALARILRNNCGVSAIAVGIDHDEGNLEPLFEWADRIILLHEDWVSQGRVPEKFRSAHGRPRSPPFLPTPTAG